MSEIYTDLDKEMLAIAGEELYSSWVRSPYRKAVLALEEPTPSEILSNIVRASNNGETSILEDIIMKLVDKARKGEDKAIEKVYNELQHQGVQKHAMAVQHEIRLSPAAYNVLSRMGYSPEGQLLASEAKNRLNSDIVDLEPILVEDEDLVLLEDGLLVE